MNALSLYSITEELALLLESDEDNGEQIDALLPVLNHKVAAVAHWCQLEKDRAGALKRRGEAILEEVRLAEARVQRRKDYLKACMEQANITKITDTRSGTVIAIQNNGGVLPLVIDDEEALRGRGYVKEVPKPLDTDAIRSDLERGLLDGGAHFGERGQHVRIRG